MPKDLANGLTREKLSELARTGAEVALQRLRAEIVAIERAFPNWASLKGVGPCADR